MATTTPTIQMKDRMVKDWKYAKHFEASVTRLQEELEQIKTKQDALNTQLVNFVFAVEDLQKQIEVVKGMLK